MSKPDFLCVGMQKAATGTLWRFLSNDDRFWMPMVKELSHFNHGSLKANKVEQGRRLYNRFAGVDRRKLAKINRRRAAKGRDTVEIADVGFVENYYRYLHNGGSDEDYLKLFDSAPEGRLSGDITPNYSGMREDKIEHVRQVLPHVQIVLLLRNPVERLWSAYNMRLRHDLRDNDPDADKVHDLDSIQQAARGEMALQDYMHRPGVLGRSFPSVVYRKWSQVFGAGRLHVVLFEDFIVNQQQTVDELYPLLSASATGFDPVDTPRATIPIYPSQVACGGTGQPSVHKNRGTKMDIAAGERELLEDYMAEEIERCIDLFGERFIPWRRAHR